MGNITRETIEQVLREECLKVTNGMEYQHNVTHLGIINAIEKLLLMKDNEKSEAKKDS